jgi:Domain of unknown function (DUF5658)
MIDADQNPDRSRRRVEDTRWLRLIRGLVAGLLVLNLLDALFTLLWVHAGYASEANALLRDLVQAHPVRFVLVKVGLVGLGSTLLWRYRRRPSAVVGIFVAFLVYYFLLLYHLRFLSHLAILG